MPHEPVGRQNGAAIRALREARGLSRSALAARAGLKPQALTNIENGSRPASKKAISNIAHSLAVPPAAITRDGVAAEIFQIPDGELEAAEADAAA